MSMRHYKQKLARDPVKWLLRPLLRWEPPAEQKPGYTVVLGVPWMLRELLPVNLRFIQKMNNAELDRINIVFDRPPQPEGDAVIAATKAAFPDLPLHFQFHRPLPGRIIKRVNRSKFYASMNWYLGLSASRTRYAVLHDFDLFPYDPDFFAKIVANMRDHQLRFSGAEHTHFDGLTDDDALIGTWELGVDAQWLRQTYRPTQCFHAVIKVNSRWVDLDAFSAIQYRTPQRRLAPDVGPQSFAHVKNLCSTYLLYAEGKPARIAWRLHFLWYLRQLAGREGYIEQIAAQMDDADSPHLAVDGHDIDFSTVDASCAAVLRRNLEPMERTLYGSMRPNVDAYIDSMHRFLLRFGTNTSAAEPAASMA